MRTQWHAQSLITGIISSALLYAFCIMSTFHSRVEPLWIKHLWNHENMLENMLMSVNHSTRSGGIIEIFPIFFNMKVYCVFSLESPHRGDSNEYTQYTIFNI